MMSKPRGLEHFKNFFADYDSDYVIIGGSAASVLLENDGLEFRSTVDIDVVILTNSSKKLNSKLSEYITVGAYETKEATEGKPKYYRFTDPKSEEFPKIIEIFARNEPEFTLADDQHIIPIQKIDNKKLSAILLDDEYFELIKSGSISTSENYSIVNTRTLICLKAGAYRDLLEKKKSGDKSIDSKEILKHLRDIFRITPVIKQSDKGPLEGKPGEDLKFAISDLESLNPKSTKQFMKKSPIKNQDELLQILKDTFRIPILND